MTRTIVVHSHRGGTGKSSVLANLALLLAAAGQRVGVVDTDLQSPTLDLLFGVAPAPARWPTTCSAAARSRPPPGAPRWPACTSYRPGPGRRPCGS